MPEASKLQMWKKFKVVGGVICWSLLVFLYLFSMASKLSRIKTTNSKSIQVWEQRWESKLDPTMPISCDRTHFDYEQCYLHRPTILDPRTATFFTADPTNSTRELVEKIRPYPRNFLHTPFNLVREVTLTTAPPNVSCAVTHYSPALIFSAGAWPGNFYHDFNENFIPLFITVDTFFPNHDFILGIFNCSDWWIRHYIVLLSNYTRHRIINLDEENAVHCFPSAIIGLISHGSSIVDPTLQRGPHPKSLLDFRSFIASAYDSSHVSHESLHWRFKGRPRLVLLNQKGAPRILNIDEVYRAALVVGFDAVVYEPSRETSLSEDYRFIHSSHALIAVHGAGLTNMLFLRHGSVLMQLAPKECDWLGNLFYGKMAIRLGLEYMVYDIGEDESRLGLNNATRERLEREGGNLENWVWYKDQQMKLDIVRFNRYLKRAYKKAKIFMDKDRLEEKYYSTIRQEFIKFGRKFKIS